MPLYLNLALAGDAEASRSLAAAGVGLRPLTPNRQATAMAEAAVGADLHQPFDVLRAIAAEVALDLAVLDRFAKFHHLVLGQVLDRGIGVDFGLGEDLLRRRLPNPEDVGEPDFDPFVDGDVDPCDTRHG